MLGSLLSFSPTDFFPFPSTSALGVIIVSQLTAFMQEDMAQMTTAFLRLEDTLGGSSVADC